MAGESNTCPDCGGAVLPAGEFCTTCMGRGAIPVTGIDLYFKKTFEDFPQIFSNDFLSAYFQDFDEHCPAQSLFHVFS